MVQIDDAAAALMREHAEGRRFHSLREAFPFDDIATAYAIQDRFVRTLRTRDGAGVAGYKIGLTSSRMQAMCGIPHPIAGVVLEGRVHPSGATLPLSGFGRLGIEFEVAVRIGRPLGPDSGISGLADLAEAVAAVAPAVELIDDRGADYTSLDMLSLVADNSWNAGIVLGAFRETWPDLAAIEGTAEQAGAVMDRGHGRDAMGHPFEPLLWLCRHLWSRGEGLKAGDVVMTGSLMPTRFPAAGESYRFTLAGLGAVDVAFT